MMHGILLKYAIRMYKHLAPYQHRLKYKHIFALYKLCKVIPYYGLDNEVCDIISALKRIGKKWNKL